MTKSDLGVMRRMTPDDLELVLEWRNDDAVRRHMFNTRIISPADHQSWFDRASREPARHLFIFEHDDRSKGFVNFHFIAPGGIADWGFYCAPDAARGTGRLLAHAALRCAFTEIQAHKLCAQVIAENNRSITFHLKQGFKQEGILREQHFDGQRYHDVRCFGMLAGDWRTIS